LILQVFLERFFEYLTSSGPFFGLMQLATVSAVETIFNSFLAEFAKTSCAQAETQPFARSALQLDMLPSGNFAHLH